MRQTNMDYMSMVTKEHCPLDQFLHLIVLDVGHFTAANNLQIKLDYITLTRIKING